MTDESSEPQSEWAYSVDPQVISKGQQKEVRLYAVGKGKKSFGALELWSSIENLKKLLSLNETKIVL